MKKYLFKASYTTEGVKGLLKVGGTNRKQVVEKMFTDMGGKMEAFYFAFGEHQVYVIGEVPDETTMAAFVMTINASGFVFISASALLTPEEIDQATKVSVNYRTPGS
jgi:uncharacterized protein with GYD domain